MTREEIIDVIKSILEELDYSDAVSYLTQNDRKWLEETIKALDKEPCEDAVSRQAVLDLCDSKDPEYKTFHLKEDVECLPPANPQEPKTGRWIFTKTKLDRYGCTAECASCHKKWKTYDEIRFKKEHNYCPNCGCCMVEPQESEEYTMIFEVGKTYQHTTGKRMTIIGRLKTHTYGECLIGEHDTGELVPVGECADGWHESEDKIRQDTGEQMEFPETFEQFAKQYGFKDDKEVYTSGSDLIPVFRVKQWLEHDNRGAK